ncbi:MAG: RsmE family RNA methyltransferase, partial [Gammaproteobacteria bacterium]|nr:RsmE family RNA methyltransferase [Gammaproteobacteria bacterium]
IAASRVDQGIVAIAVGPEGGWSPAELERLATQAQALCHLGPRTLRTETAGIAALAVLQSLAGDCR